MLDLRISLVSILLFLQLHDGATLDIRKSGKIFTVDDYLSFKTMTKDMADFLRWCVWQKNIIVSGGTGSGKTTYNFLSNYIPENEAIVTIEDLLELQLIQPNIRPWKQSKNAEGTGEISIRDCVVNSFV